MIKFESPWYFFYHHTHADYYFVKTGTDFLKVDEVKLREVLARRVFKRISLRWASDKSTDCHDVIYLSSLYPLVTDKNIIMSFTLKLEMLWIFFNQNWSLACKETGYLFLSYNHSNFLFLKIKEGLSNYFLFLRSVLLWRMKHWSTLLKLINYSCTDDPIRLLQFGQVHGSWYPMNIQIKTLEF